MTLQQQLQMLVAQTAVAAAPASASELLKRARVMKRRQELARRQGEWEVAEMCAGLVHGYRDLAGQEDRSEQ